MTQADQADHGANDQFQAEQDDNENKTRFDREILEHEVSAVGLRILVGYWYWIIETMRVAWVLAKALP
jgi:hypothetical protein